ncbi:pyrroloquinoline quinone biosynthesis protein PqqB [Ancylobacter sp. TS-1]|uniref:pyrroloquinoline quinone biosynthesis protein PqqB n=1 Tax=Ancylobacter sp. TS-1 TaxID=1850374 RepID=UPI001265B28D|nr:pyrroloquinoline quinone biosynthesis protein PqqB [Ancylobacter sp. TS-1]QFR31946.1 pyrroloquinoline quinone biosynthesis protein PqqB [Ancylobacter sp. TS-1]
MLTFPPRLRLVVLGSAAGGGFPQWNCRCAVCSLAWAGDPRVRRRTQASVAVSADGVHWALVNCAPEVLSQIQAVPALHPQAGLRHSPVSAVLLTNADIDHVAGLLSLREAQPFSLLATPAVHEVLRTSSAFDVLAEGVVERRPVELGASFELVEGVSATIFPVPGKIALYLEAREEAEKGRLVTDIEGEQTIGVELSAGGRRVLYIPGCAAMTDALRERLEGADVVLFDGTLWRDDEMVRAGVGTKTGARMGHMSMSGEGGSIEALRKVKVGRKIYVHINNTNPVLVDGSEERITANKAGWEIAQDGMEIAL